MKQMKNTLNEQTIKGDVRKLCQLLVASPPILNDLIKAGVIIEAVICRLSLKVAAFWKINLLYSSVKQHIPCSKAGRNMYFVSCSLSVKAHTFALLAFTSIV